MKTASPGALEAAVLSGELDSLAYWAELSGFAGFLQSREVRAAIEVDAAHAPALISDLEAIPGRAMPSLHRTRLKEQGHRFACLQLPLDRLPDLARLPGVKSVMPGFISGERGPVPLPSQDLPFDQLHASPAERAQLVQQLNELQAHGSRVVLTGQPRPARLKRARTPERDDDRDQHKPLIGVIDFGCAFLHPALLRRGPAGEPPRTRVLALWDQGRNHKPHPDCPAQAMDVWPWETEDGMGYGRVATGDRLDLLAAAYWRSPELPQRGEGGLDPACLEACYLAAGMPELLSPASHGTAVLGLAAGRGEVADAAADAEILFVQLPRDAVRDLSGGWLTAYLLDALTWLEAQAKGRRLIVNLSLGSHAGPHDGQSLVERLLDDFASRHVLVLAAGNAAARRGHAEAMLGAHQANELHWLMPERDPTQSFLEAWYSTDGNVDAVEVFFGHEQVPAQRLKGAGTRELRDRQGALVGVVVHVPPGPGRASGHVWIALAPTLPQAAATAPGGRWTLSIRPVGDGHLQAHAWLERDEPGVLPLSDRPDSVLQAPPGSAWAVNDCMTLTAQAAASGPLVVGGLVVDGLSGAPTLFRHTGLGPTRGRRRKLDAWAPADERIRGLDRGLPVLGNHSDPALDGRRQPPRMKGTSLSAPLLLRCVYNQMAADPQLTSSLQARKWVAAHAAATTGWVAPALPKRPPGLPP